MTTRLSFEHHAVQPHLKNRMFEEFPQFEKSRLDPTNLPKNLAVDKDREHIKMLYVKCYMMIFVI